MSTLCTMSHSSDLTVTWVSSLTDIDPTAWNALAVPLDTPFLEYEWLSLLERSGSVCARTGWEPRYLLCHRQGSLVAACPLYRKTHSEGEFVFDYPWAEAARSLGLSYFPKLVGMSPVTPVGAFQFMIHPAEDGENMMRLLCRTILDYAVSQGLGGVHLQYVARSWVEPLARCGFTEWEHPCYLWTNPGYASFDDFLSVLSKNARHSIRREEHDMRREGITVRMLTGNDINPRLHEPMYRYYLSTNEKFGYWAALYLTGIFFEGLFREFRQRLAVAAAFRNGEDEPLAMALFLTKGKRLWGRYWGGREYVPHLHFNVCYYAPLRWAIDHGITSFDPGIGTAHKARRGFTACPGSSLHRFTDERMDRLFKGNIGKFNRYSRQVIEELNSGKKPEGW